MRACVEDVPANAIVPFFMIPSCIPDVHANVVLESGRRDFFSVRGTNRADKRIDTSRYEMFAF